MVISNMMGSSPNAQILIDDYFRTMRLLCTQKLSRSKVQEIEETGQGGLKILLSVVLHVTPPEDTPKVFASIQTRFMLVLQDYDLPWVWNIYNEFSSTLPETMLN